MKDLTKIYIDLSKCTEEQRKHIISLLPKPENQMQYKVFWRFKYLQFSSDLKKWIVQSDTENKTEVTYPEFTKLFEGGEEKEKQLYAVAIVFHKNMGSTINSELRLTYLQALSGAESIGLALEKIENAESDLINNGWEIHLKSTIKIDKY